MSSKSCLSFQGRLPAVWGPGEGPAHCVTGDAITQGRGGAAASFKYGLPRVRERERRRVGSVFLFRGGRGLGQSRRGPRGGRQDSFVTETRWGGRARESREAGTWRPIGRPGPCTANANADLFSGFAGRFLSSLEPCFSFGSLSLSLPSVFLGSLAPAPLRAKVWKVGSVGTGEARPLLRERL